VGESIPSTIEEEDAVDAIVGELRTLARAATLELAVRVGRVVVERFYGGRVEVWRQRGRRCPSFRKLAEHPDLPMSATALYRSVCIFEVFERLGGIATWKHVGASHVRAVLPLPPTDQERLLLDAEASGWSVRRLDEEAARLRAVRSERRGRPRQPRVVKALRELERCMSALDDLEVTPVPEPLAPELRRRLDALRRCCDALERALPDRTSS
jgi:hypothetical protein